MSYKNGPTPVQQENMRRWSREWRQRNRATVEAKRAAGRADPTIRAKQNLQNRLNKFKLTLEQLEMFWLNQLGECAICERDLPTAASGYIDHCHATGKVRGLLCNECNTGLGMFKERTASFRAAIAYLEKHRS